MGCRLVRLALWSYYKTTPIIERSVFEAGSASVSSSWLNGAINQAKLIYRQCPSDKANRDGVLVLAKLNRSSIIWDQYE